MEKPVVILGGGILGSLLAIKVKQCLPYIQIRLYEGKSYLPIGPQTVTDGEIYRHRQLLKPFIASNWKGTISRTMNSEKYHLQTTHLLSAEAIQKRVAELLGNDLKFNNNPSLELALKESSFVIDARGISFFPKHGYRRMSFQFLEFEEPHHHIVPVVYDSNHVSDHSLHRAYYPLEEKTMLIKEVSYRREVHGVDQGTEAFLRDKGWRVKRVMREEVYVQELPLSHPFIPQEGRVISLAGFGHYVTGCELKAGLDLIEDMVRTSFRFGELREIVKAHRQRHMEDSEFNLFVNQQLVKSKSSPVLDAIYEQHPFIHERFQSNHLSFLDRSLIALSGWLTFRQSPPFQHQSLS